MEKIRIGEQIRLLRRKNDVTQDQLAGHLGVTPQAVSRWESGVCYPDMGYLPAIADFFSVSMDELLCYADRRTEKRVQDCIGQVDTLLEAERVPQAPYFKQNNIPFGTSWNTAQNYTQGRTIRHYAATLPFMRNTQAIEIPFANFGAVTVDRNAMLAYGASIARAACRYLLSSPGTQPPESDTAGQ